MGDVGVVAGVLDDGGLGHALVEALASEREGGTAAAGADAGSAIAVPAIAPRASARPPVPGLRRLEATG